MSVQNSSVPQFKNVDHPFFPQSYRPYTRCDCGLPEACGNSHKITPNSAGAVHEMPHRQRSFHHWEQAAVKNDLQPRKSRPYEPPANPFVCDRPITGQAQTCAYNAGSDRCPP